MTPVRRQFMAPRIFARLQPRARGKFKLGLARQGLARPCRIALCISMHDMDDRVIGQIINRAVGPGRVAPIGPGHPAPPLRGVCCIHRAVGHGENGGAWRGKAWVHAGVMRGVRRGFGKGAIARCAHEIGELRVGYWRLVDPERRDLDAAQRRFFGVELRRAHGERAAGDERHAFGLIVCHLYALCPP